MPKPDRSVFEAAKQEFKEARETFQANVAAAEAQVEAGTLTPEGFAEILSAEHALLKAAQQAFVAAVKAAHGKPAKDKKPKPVAA